VPVAAYVVELVPLHDAAGGVVHVTPLHGSTHRPLVASHTSCAAAQSTVVGA